jgi:hypothetical protein
MNFETLWFIMITFTSVINKFTFNLKDLQLMLQAVSPPLQQSTKFLSQLWLEGSSKLPTTNLYPKNTTKRNIGNKWEPLQGMKRGKSNPEFCRKSLLYHIIQFRI